VDKLNPLICSPSPRDIPRWLEAMKKLDFVDRLYCKYFTPEKLAYDIGRNYFITHEEYTHLVIIPDDLIVEPDQLKSMITTVERTDFPVFSGVANMDLTAGKDMFSISFDVIHIDPNRRRYSLISREEINEYARRGRYMKVNWAGFPCMFIRRDIVEKFEFNLDGIARHDSNGFTGCCTDTVFCFECYICDVPIYVDPAVQMLHLKISDSYKEYFYAGTSDHPSHAYLEKSKINEVINVSKKDFEIKKRGS
jgi:hypothetical protein